MARPRLRTPVVPFHGAHGLCHVALSRTRPIALPSLLTRRVEAHVAEHQQGEEGDPLGIRLANVPQPILPPERQQPRAPAFGGNAGTLRGDLVGRAHRSGRAAPASGSPGPHRAASRARSSGRSPSFRWAHRRGWRSHPSASHGANLGLLRRCKPRALFDTARRRAGPVTSISASCHDDAHAEE